MQERKRFLFAPSVLIAPLWNWNRLAKAKDRAPFKVLIAPLWNWNPATAAGISLMIRSNRTFMELKSPSTAAHTSPRRILIAPLWNWNWSVLQVVAFDPKVLIAPLWNWNWIFLGSQQDFTRSNRTFMELKSEISFTSNGVLFWF